MPVIVAYNGSVGLNNKVPAHRLPFDAEAGVSALECADNVMVDRTGEVVTYRGDALEFEGSYHSLFPGKDWGLVAKDRVNDTAIYKVTVSDAGKITLNGLASGLTKGRRIEYCRVGEKIFYTNGAGFEHGMIVDGVETSWKESQWFDDNTTAGFLNVPPADHLAYNAGRIYFSLDKEIYYTEFGMLGIYDPETNGEQFPTKILAIAPAADGLYVCDTTTIYFFAGLDPHDWTMRKVAEYPVLEWGKFYGVVDPSFWGFETNVPCSLLATKNGPLLCMPSGQVVNLIDKNVTMPNCAKDGAVGVFNETLIIQTGE